LRASHLRAWVQGHEATRLPGCSGCARHAPWPPEAQQLARKLLTSDLPASYSLTASELHRASAKSPTDPACAAGSASSLARSGSWTASSTSL
jgi:hypothetical protein